MIRATLTISRAVNKYKNDYPNLYNDFQIARKRKEYCRNSWVKVSDNGSEEYLKMIKEHFLLKKFPNNNREVIITTHNGGKFVGFYQDGKWWYNTIDSVIEEKGYVIKWEKYR